MDGDTSTVEQAATDAGTAEPDTPSSDQESAEQQAARQEVGESFKRLSEERSIEDGWTGRPEPAGDGDTSEDAEPAADPNAIFAAIDYLGIEPETRTEYAAWIRDHPEVAEHLHPVASGDVEQDAEALQANLDLLDQLRAGEDAQDQAYWAQQELASTQLDAYARQLTDAAEANPEQAPLLLAHFLNAGGDISEAGDLVELGDEAYGEGATLSLLREAAGIAQGQVQQAEAAAIERQAMAELGAQWEAATAADEYHAAMVQPAVEFATRNPEAAALVQQALEHLPQLAERMADPQAAAAELARLEAVAEKWIAIDRDLNGCSRMASHATGTAARLTRGENPSRNGRHMSRWRSSCRRRATRSWPPGSRPKSGSMRRTR